MSKNHVFGLPQAVLRCRKYGIMCMIAIDYIINYPHVFVVYNAAIMDDLNFIKHGNKFLHLS